jgi:hypothetical protein
MIYTLFRANVAQHGLGYLSLRFLLYGEAIDPGSTSEMLEFDDYDQI